MCIHTIPIPTKKVQTSAKRTNLYIKDRAVDKFDRFIKLAKRQGTSASEVFEKAMDEWMLIHEPGNTLTTLHSFSDMGLVTDPQYEGRIRQQALETISKQGEISLREIRDIAESHGLKGRRLVRIQDNVVEWLSHLGHKVWR